jgi:transforming growth factor-beta-induced protein
MTNTTAATVDLVDTAIAAKFSTLVAAVKAAGLVDTLKGTGPFTVFAPTDEAFAKLPKGTLENLLKPENKTKLQGILKYHVVAGKVMAADVVKLHSAKTVEGHQMAIKTTDGKVMVDGAHVTKTDVAASNGVIHVIDAVILPK